MILECPVCELNGNDSNFKSFDTDLKECPGCGHVWQYPATITAEYNEGYVKERYDKYDTTEIMSYLRLGIVKAFVHNGTLLDTGYGNGSFIKAASKAGFDCYGSDVHGADYGVKDIELEVAASMNWDVATMFDSLEHFDDLTIIRRICERANTVVISMPCRPKDFPNNADWKHRRVGEHLQFFSEKSLEILCDKYIVYAGDAEDAIRGKLKDATNIQTWVLQ